MKKIVASLIAVTILVSGCGLFKKSPQETVDKAFQKFADVKKMASLLDFKGTVQSPAGEQPAKIDFAVKVEGSSDVSDAKSPKLDMKFTINGTADAEGGSAEVMLRTVDKKIFVNVASLKLAGGLGAQLNDQLAALFNKWWSLPMGEGNPLGNLTEQQTQLQEKFKSLKFFTNAVEDAPEVLQGIETTRYRVDLSKEALKQFILDLAQSSGNQLTPEDSQAISDSLNDVEFSGAVWVGNSDDTLHRIRGTVTVQPKQGPASSFDIDYTGWNFGKDVAVQIPEGAQEFNPLMLGILLGGLSGMGAEATPEAVPALPGAAVDSPLGASQVKKK
ncbi:MAG: hypothetical protein AAB588_03000 [Patescibacteria group bacterium]